MCTCGIDIATQQLTPATHSSPSSTLGGMSRFFLCSDISPVTDSGTGGLLRRANASGIMVSMMNTPAPV